MKRPRRKVRIGQTGCSSEFQTETPSLSGLNIAFMPIACHVTMSCLRWIDRSTGKRAGSTGKPGVGGYRPVGVDGSASKVGKAPDTTEQRLG
jgi:hypothetical protein